MITPIQAEAVNAGETSVQKLQSSLAALHEENKAFKEAKKKNGGAGEPDSGISNEQSVSPAQTAAKLKKLREQLNAERLRSAVMIELTKAHANDVDYLLYLAEKEDRLKSLKISGDGKVTGASDLVKAMKQQYTAQFAAEPRSTLVRVGIKKLEGQAGRVEPATMEESFQQKYNRQEEN